MTIREVARRADLAESTVYRLEAEDRGQPQADTIAALAQALGVSADELLGIGKPEEATPSHDDETIELPIVGRVSAGEGAIAEEYIEGYETVDRSDLHGPPERYFFLRAKGDSMRDAGIFDGTLLLVDREAEIRDADIAVVEVEDEALVKRVYFADDHILLVSENRDYRPQQVPRDIRFIGRVIMAKTYF